MEVLERSKETFLPNRRWTKYCYLKKLPAREI